MADTKITISVDIFRKKNPEEFTLALADPKGKPETGSAAASVAAMASALLLRAANVIGAEKPENERIQYVVRNAEILRSYMVHLIDEDVKCRAPLAKALREGGTREIEASRHPACAICNEIVCMMEKCLEFAVELSDGCPKAERHHLTECGELAMAAIRTAQYFVLDVAGQSTDDTFAYVTKRENEIVLEQYEALLDRLRDSTAE